MDRIEYEAHMAEIGRATIREAVRMALFVALLALGLLGMCSWTGGPQ